MTPQIDTGITQTNIQEYEQPNLTYRVENDIVSGMIDGIDALKQAVKHILVTERYSSPIYDENYGVELEKYLGTDIATIQADIETTLREALLQDNRITNVYVNSVEQDSLDSCIVNFTVDSIYGSYEETINIVS